MNSEIEQFIQSVRRHNPTAKTWRSYSSDLRLFASLTGEVSPNPPQRPNLLIKNRLKRCKIKCE